MPEAAKGPRLWLRRERRDRSGAVTHKAMWFIRDDGRYQEGSLARRLSAVGPPAAELTVVPVLSPSCGSRTAAFGECRALRIYQSFSEGLAISAGRKPQG